jgi:hypothetical protein
VLQSPLMLPLPVVTIACYVVVGMRVHRMANVWTLSHPRPLGHRQCGGLVFPIPIATLWKPCQALKEVRQATRVQSCDRFVGVFAAAVKSAIRHR